LRSCCASKPSKRGGERRDGGKRERRKKKGRADRQGAPGGRADGAGGQSARLLGVPVGLGLGDPPGAALQISRARRTGPTAVSSRNGQQGGRPTRWVQTAATSGTDPARAARLAGWATGSARPCSDSAGRGRGDGRPGPLLPHPPWGPCPTERDAPATWKRGADPLLKTRL
jgi:hypothetical protein